MADVCLFALLQIKVSVVRREEDEDEEEASSPLTCEECGRSDRGHQLLMCIHCDSGYNVALVHFDIFNSSVYVLLTCSYGAHSCGAAAG